MQLKTLGPVNVKEGPHKHRSTDVWMWEADLTLTNSIGAHPVQHATLGDGFEGGTSQDTVHSLPQEFAVAQIWCHVVGKLPQLAVVGVRHAGEADAKPEGRRTLLKIENPPDDWGNIKAIHQVSEIS